MKSLQSTIPYQIANKVTLTILSDCPWRSTAMARDVRGFFRFESKKLYNFSFLLLLLVKTTAFFSIDRIESCLMEKVEQEANTPSKRGAAMFHLHFGDPAVEVLNAINSSDIRRIKSLSNCVKVEDTFLFESTG